MSDDDSSFTGSADKAASADLNRRGRIYAIGDVHGCSVELNKLLGMIDAKPGDTVVFLGDYIDRGYDSAGTVRMVRAYQPKGVEVVRLKGNHEDMMVQVHGNRGLWDWWLRNGGTETLQSYGGEIPADVLEWCRALPTSFRAADYFFCHAGVHPGVALADQDDESLLWIRSKFLMSAADHGARVIHGHTPSEEVEVQPNRINVDTGCVYGGHLTAVMLGKGEPTFLRVRREATATPQVGTTAKTSLADEAQQKECP